MTGPSSRYGQIFSLAADGTDLRMLTDSLWEDAMPCYVPTGATRVSSSGP